MDNQTFLVEVFSINKNFKPYIRMFKLKSIYFKLFVIISSLIMVPSIFIGAFVYNRAATNFEAEINKYNLKALGYIRDEAMTMFNMADILSIHFAMSSDVKYFASNSLDSDRLLVTRVYNDINNNILANPFIESLYIHYDNSHEMITQNGTYNLKDFNDQDWYNQVENETSKMFFLPTRKFIEKTIDTKVEKQVITLVRFFPMFSQQNSGEVVVNINIKSLQNKISEIGNREKGSIFIIDEKGKILISDNEEYLYRNLNDLLGIQLFESTDDKPIEGVFGGERVIISVTKSNIRNWKFIQITPRKSITKSIDFIKKIEIAVLVVMGFVAIFVVVFIDNKIYKYITSMMDAMNNKTSYTCNKFAKNEMEALRLSIIDIAESVKKKHEENSALQERFYEARNVMIRAYFKDAILCHNQENNKIIDMLSIQGWPQDNYIVFIISIDDITNFNRKWNKYDQALWKFTIINIGEEIINSKFKGLIFNDDQNEWVAVVHIPNLEGNKVYEQVNVLADNIRQAINKYIRVFTVSIGIGTISTDVSTLHESYNSAIKAFKMKWMKGKDTTLRFVDLKSSNSRHYYNTASEKLIMAALKKNDITNARNSLKIFIKELLSESDGDCSNVYEGLVKLGIAMLRMVEEMGYKPEEVFVCEFSELDYNFLEDFKGQETFDDSVNWLNERFISISNFLWEKHNRRDYPEIKSIIEYIDANYTKDLYLSALSEMFNIRESQVSKAFKQFTGQNFLEYLTKLRIEKAREYLRDTNYSVNDISKMVGYLNVQTFIRMFKKEEGITPGQYRESIGN